MNFAAAILYAVSSSTLLAVLLGFLRGGLSPSSAGLSLGCGLLVASATLWQGRYRRSHVAPGPWEWTAIAAYGLVTLRIFLWVVFIDGDDIKLLSPNNLGDFSLHLTYVRNLASGVAFWPDNPIYYDGRLTYPVGVDLFHSLLLLLGADVFRTFMWMGVVGSAVTGVALWRWGRGWTLFGFLSNGGLAALAIFHTGRLADFQATLGWKSFALALLATQRGLLFAIPAGLLLLVSWRKRFFYPEEEDRLPRWGEVLLYASLPLFHFHTFLFLSVLLATWFLLQPSARRSLLELVGAAFLPATFLVLMVTGGLHGGHLLGWKPGWMWDDSGGVDLCAQYVGQPARLYAALLFWPVNFGILPILVFILLWRLWRQPESLWARAITFPALGIFLVCCFVKFAPWEWDNTKLMLWSYLAILPILWSELVVRWSPWTRFAIGLALFGSGFASTLGGIDNTHRGYPVANRSILDNVERAVRSIPPSDRFAGAPTYNHPLLLCGRKMTLGYLGHVASHGLPWEEPANDLQALMMGDPAWRDLAAKLKTRYLFWGQQEEDSYKDSTQPWKEAARQVASGEWGAIYDLHEPAGPKGLPAMSE